MIFKKKPIVIEAYAPVGDLLDYFPIVKSVEALPDWFYNIPKDNDNTVRNCYGLRDLFSHGFVVPAWADFEIFVNPDGSADVNSPLVTENRNFSQHNVSLEAPNAWAGFTNVKLLNPWFFYCDEPIKWMVIDPTWSRRDPTAWATPSGLLEFRINNQLHVNTLFKIQPNRYMTKVKAGDTLLHVIPITDRPFEVKMDVLTEEIYQKKFAGWSHSFRFGYQRMRKIMEKRKKI